MKHPNSLYIILDGIDGCGKGTQITRLAKYFFDRNKRHDHIVLAREPTYGEEGLKIREILTSHSDPYEGAQKCLELFLKDRVQNLSRFIIPILENAEGQSLSVVIQDRGKYSTAAYQGAQGINVKNIIRMHEENAIIQRGIPDLVLILDVPVDVALKRREASGEDPEKFEHPDFLKVVRQHYLKMPEYFPLENIKIINGDKPVEHVFKNIQSIVDRLFPF